MESFIFFIVLKLSDTRILFTTAAWKFESLLSVQWIVFMLCLKEIRCQGKMTTWQALRCRKMVFANEYHNMFIGWLNNQITHIILILSIIIIILRIHDILNIGQSFDSKIIIWLSFVPFSLLYKIFHWGILMLLFYKVTSHNDREYSK